MNIMRSALLDAIDMLKTSEGYDRDEDALVELRLTDNSTVRGTISAATSDNAWLVVEGGGQTTIVNSKHVPSFVIVHKDLVGR